MAPVRAPCFIVAAVKPASGGARSLGSGPEPLGKASESHLFSGNSRKVVDRRDAVVHWSRPAAWGHLSPGAAMDLRQALPVCGLYLDGG